MQNFSTKRAYKSGLPTTYPVAHCTHFSQLIDCRILSTVLQIHHDTHPDDVRTWRRTAYLVSLNKSDQGIE
jgi:hypothetical protein